jgi:hypothetical protein
MTGGSGVVFKIQWPLAMSASSKPPGIFQRAFRIPAMVLFNQIDTYNQATAANPRAPDGNIPFLLDISREIAVDGHIQRP